MFASLLLFFLALAVVLQLGYALCFFSRIFFLEKEQPQPGAANTEGVSIIICARNEASNLRLHLPAVLAQRYKNEAGQPNYEVIVVNDASEDDTKELLAGLQLKYPHLRQIDIQPGAARKFPGKKFAVSEGLKQASYSLLLLTDADCFPATEDWLSEMSAPLQEGKMIAAGYGKFVLRDNFLNAFIRFETMHSFLQYATYALAGKPYMAVGRNLACRKEMMIRAQRSEAWNLLPSGDDDLMVRTIATKENTAVVATPSSFTVSETMSTWKEWVAQKQRHLSTGKYYRPGIKALLSIYASSHALMWLSILALLFTGLWKTAIVLILLRSVFYWFIWSYTAYRLQEKKLWYLFPVFDLGWMIYNFAFSPYIIWKNKQQWTSS